MSPFSFSARLGYDVAIIAAPAPDGNCKGKSPAWPLFFLREIPGLAPVFWHLFFFSRFLVRDHFRR
jgi:hypothetical protein